MEFSKEKPLTMHVDMDSFFASCEQQVNPFLRGKCVCVVPYMHNRSTIIAPSIEAKERGVKTGMRIFEARKIFPDILPILANPSLYRNVHKSLIGVLNEFSPDIHVKSIDEATLFFTKHFRRESLNLEAVANSIKVSLQGRVGDFLKCSIGVSTNSFVAKVASNVCKPNGYCYVDYTKITRFYDMLKLGDLHGVGPRIKSKLNSIGVYTPNEFRKTSLIKLKSTFKTPGYYWHLRLNGYEIDNIKFPKKSISHSFHLVKFSKDEKVLCAIILKLSEKVGRRMRSLGYRATGVSFHCIYCGGTSFLKSRLVKKPLNSSYKLYLEFLNLFNCRKGKGRMVKIIGVSAEKLVKNTYFKQLDFFGEEERIDNLYKSLDRINSEYGEFVIAPGTLLNYKNIAPERIAFGK